MFLARYQSYMRGFTVLTIGIEVSTLEGTRKIKAATVGISCDLPARAMVLNMKQFNGKNACHMCKDDGETLLDNNLVRFWPHRSPSVHRTRASLIQDSCDARYHDEPVGFVAIAVTARSLYIHLLRIVQRCDTEIALHRPLDICSGVIIDSLHCIFLKLMNLWFGKDTRLQEYSIRVKVCMLLCLSTVEQPPPWDQRVFSILNSYIMIFMAIVQAFWGMFN